MQQIGGYTVTAGYVTFFERSDHGGASLILERADLPPELAAALEVTFAIAAEYYVEAPGDDPSVA